MSPIFAPGRLSPDNIIPYNCSIETLVFFFLILRVYIFFLCFLLFITVVYATYDVLKRTFFFVSSKSRCVAGEDCRRVFVFAFFFFFFYLCLHLPDYGSLL